MPIAYTEGPLGLPMKDSQARALEPIIKALPKDADHAPRRALASRGVSELLPESRCDVSWITVEAPDHTGDLVLANGMDDSIYRLNPIVTLNHHYDRPPVGRSLWRRKMVRARGARSSSAPDLSTGLQGIKAKTFYPPTPTDWPGGEWPPDMAFFLLQAGLLAGKSIGFMPLQLRPPTAEEVERQPQLTHVRAIIEKWLLLEYACCYLPMQPLALVEEVAKTVPEDWCAAASIPRKDPACPPDAPQNPSTMAPSPSDVPMSLPSQRPVPFTAATDLRESLRRRLGQKSFVEMLQKSAQRTWKIASTQW